MFKNSEVFLTKLIFLFFPVDSDLVEFLTEEIAAEKGNQKALKDLPGFEVKKEGAELTFTKAHGLEK